LLGQACNDAGLAVLDAEVQFARSAEVFMRSCDREEQGEPVDLVSWVAGEHYFACRDHIERLTAMYARASARYAVCAVETASQVADGREPVAPTPEPPPPSDVLALAQIHVPLFQIPQRMVTDSSRDRIAKENAELVRGHRRLIQAMAAVESPAAAFDEPTEVAKRQTADLLETEFPAALHAYASDCVWALELMSEVHF
jgi:hypothetical protein